MRKMFSKNQIKRMVAESPEEVVEALVNQDVKVKTIEQSEANWDLDISALPMNNLPSGVSLTHIYSHLQKI